MKLEIFFEKFDQFADAPDAVAKMRDLVLRLAMSAKLVEQDSNELNGSKVFNAIQEARAKQLNSPKTSLVAAKDWETAGDDCELPNSWHRCAISDVCDLKTGATPSTTEPRNFGGNTRWLLSGDINRGEIFECEGRITERGIANSNCKLIPEDSVLIALNGQGKTRATVALLRIEAALNQSLVAMIPYSRNHLLPEFLFWNLRSRYRAIREITGHEQRRGLNMKLVGMLSLPLPPVEEQKRIVARVEGLMALCERLEAQQKERERQHSALSHAAIARFYHSPSQANLNFLFHPSYSVSSTDLRKAVLSAGIQGHLSKLLAGIATWPRVTLNSICLQITDGEHATPQRVSEGIPLATAKNIRDGFLDLTKTDWVASDTAERCWRRCKPRHNDILMVCVGATTGRICLVQDPPDMVLVRSVALIRPNEKLVLPSYLELFLRSPEGQSLVWGNVKQSAQPCLYLGKINSFEMPLPTLEEQRHIVAKVDRLMILVNQLDTQLRSSQMEATQLLDAVIHELLHPTADIIDRASQRAAIGCYAIEHLSRNPSFGRVMLMKACYLAETHLGLPLGWRPMRQAAGPWDPWMQDFEGLGTRTDWFAVTEKIFNNGRSKIEYSPKKALKAKAEEAITVLGSQKAEFDRLLNLFADKKTEEAEIITTLFAAWNDFLIDGQIPTDDEVIHEVRENWHRSKERFSPALLRRWLAWMRSHSLTPKGHPPRTRQQLAFQLK
ncbi:restriction endonuclease subunit S [Terriglobus sp. TAA 43]|uniref:restriction endonuclease subunit S n=1 Tax=Terriglobus sp. TAA 43 TaxID=278961 RepID=UPI0006492516|nr:restriction endonuclease subunit S [Terriglobus sp. TAA 43]